MNQIFNEDEKEKRPKTKIVSIRVSDLDLKMFLYWLMANKGSMSEFTRRVWKKTAEYEEYSRVKNKEWLKEIIEEAEKKN
jgi:hypothetical protein